MADTVSSSISHAHRAKLREFVAREVGEVVHHLASTIETAALEQAEAVAQALVMKAREVVERQGREIERLTTELQAERASSVTLRLEAEKAQYGRARAEEACEQAEASRHRLAVTLERELRDVRAELDVQTAEVARLRLEADAARTYLPSAPPVALANPLPSELVASGSVVGAEGPRSATVTPIRGTADSILSESATLVMNEVESRYLADVQSGLEPAQLVERLTSHLEHARSMYSRCLESVGAQDAHAFEHELARLIDRHGSTAFGRHLAVASYADQQRAAAPRDLSARAS